jgi:hypothetical protein
MMEQVHPGVSVLVEEEALGWEDLGEEEWTGPERVLVQVDNASVPNVGCSSLMKRGHRATL